MKLYLSITQTTSPWSWWPRAIEVVHATMARDGGHDWAHLGRVYTNARKIWELECAQQPEAERALSWRIIAASALFHDVINLPKDSPDRKLASTRSGEFARAWLSAHAGFDAQAAEHVHDAIRAHSFSAGFEATTLPAQILSDADRLDALGAIGIARTFAVGGQLGRALCHPVDPLAAGREPDDGLYGVDHFFSKLLKLKEMCYTEAGRDMARSRDAFMREYLEVLAGEVTLRNISQA